MKSGPYENSLVSAITEEKEIETLQINNQKVRESQIKKIQKIKHNRNENKVKKCLEKLESACENKNTNLLKLAINAAKERATLGEISYALEKKYGRYYPSHKTITGIYKMETKQNKQYKTVLELSNNFADKFGRRPRIMIAKMGQDGHDRGARVIASSFADLGFDVYIAPLFQTPKEVAKQALENDVHIL